MSSALIQGQPQSAGSGARVPAAKVEAVVLDAVRRHIGPDAPIDTTELIGTYVRQIEVRRTEIAISLLNEDNGSEDEQGDPPVLTVPWSKAPHRRHRDVIAPEGPPRTQVLPIRCDTRTKLVTAIARGRQWLSEIEAGTETNVPFYLAFTLCDLGERLNAARYDAVDPGARLGYGEENSVSGLLFEGRLGLGLMHNSLDGSERWRAPRQADDGGAAG